MARLRVPGIPDASLDGIADGPRAGGLLSVRTRGAVRLDAARGAADTVATIDGVQAEDVIELRFDGDVRIWTRFDELRRELPAATSRGAGEDLVISPHVDLGSQSRGIGSLVLKALRVFDIRPQEHAARLLAERLEGGDSRLHACPLDTPFRLEGSLEATRPDQPVLVFLHGTASTTQGSFGALWTPERAAHLRRLHDVYGDSSFAFEHRTLTQTPVRNAIDLLRALKARVRSRHVHLVSHSRGGLVGELLCRVAAEGADRPFSGAEVERYVSGSDLDPAFADEHVLKDRRDELAELAELLQDPTFQFRVERFVRVACPVRGTTLASGKLDRWLSILVNLVGRIPGFDENPIYEAVTDFTLAVARERTNPRTLPGLQAMLPEAALVRLLNDPSASVDADLSVIAGDAEGGGFLGTLKLLIPDLYFGGDHDLVVDTRSMYGGARRASGTRSFFDQGADVSHFTYFANQRTAARVVAGLTRSADSDAGYTPQVAERREVPLRAARGAPGPRPVVFVVPGIMGSHLAVGGNRIWIDLLRLAGGGVRHLGVDARNVQAQALVDLAYGNLVSFLSDTHDVVTFPYDWRLSIATAATRLAGEVGTRLDAASATGQPVRILAHSMGGLVARMMIAQSPEVWERLCSHPHGRLIMLGTPNGGSHDITRLLVGQEGLLRKLALIDLRDSAADLLAIISRFPGVLEMLPDDDNLDFFARATWERISQVDALGWSVPEPDSLDHARLARQRLAQQIPHPDRVLYVAGWAPATPVGLELHTTAPAGERLHFVATTQGDGRVPWATGILPGLRCWYMAEAEHGDLADHAPAFVGLLELLQTGNTSRLPTTPPVTLRGAEERFPMPRDVADVLPDEDELTRSAMRSRRRRAPVRPAHRIKVSITHGNLAYARHPVAVGHYVGDTIISAEADLDRHLDGRLRRRQQLGIYPGELGTHAVVLQAEANRKPAGAIVVGLGKVGELSAASLTKSFAAAARAYAVTVAERGPAGDAAPGVPRSATVTSLLIGTGAAGLPVRESVWAILRAIVRANTALREAKLERDVVLDELELVELFEDQAIHAARALTDLRGDAELRDWVTLEDPLLTQRAGGRRRVVFEEAEGWWQRLQISSRAGALRFNALTNRARAEVELVATERNQVDQFLESATRQPASSQKTARTLFEMLLPNAIKDQMPSRGHLVLVVDEAAARYPWELLEDRWADGQRPLALERGVLRQLETPAYRERVEITPLRTALIIGDPDTKGFATALPGAAAEARAVEKCLTSTGFAVRTSIHEDAQTILTALHADAYRILHLAGHGVHEYPIDTAAPACDACGHSGPPRPMRASGMVIGRSSFLTPAAVEQMRRVPEIVFVNCCHLGRTDGSRLQEGHFHELAANIAAQFIRMGVRAVVAAGWAVDDGAAETFATAFYAHLLRGEAFGDAVLRARNETYERHPAVNTWGAYQCYGDPSYAFTPDMAAAEVRPMPPLVAPAEAVVAFENFAMQARSTAVEALPALRKTLDAIVERIRPDWLQRGDVLAALGIAYGEVRELELAIEHLRKALGAPKASPLLAAVEQLANFESRAAVDHWKTGRPRDRANAKQAVDLIEGALARLERLVALGETTERLSLLGAAYKRQAVITSGRLRAAAIKNAGESYRKAHGKAPGSFEVGDPYPLLNWLAAEILRRWAGKRPKKDLDIQRWLRAAQTEGRQRDQRDPDFWNGTVAPDSAVLEHLLAEDLDREEVRAPIVEMYRELRRRAASPRELSSVLEQVEFLAEMTDVHRTPRTRTRLRHALERLCAELGGNSIPPPAVAACAPTRSTVLPGTG